ncbi:MAG: hypothetical protein ACTSXQ_02940 [Alphaproteobacteria bacterium]
MTDLKNNFEYTGVNLPLTLSTNDPNISDKDFPEIFKFEPTGFTLSIHDKEKKTETRGFYDKTGKLRGIERYKDKKEHGEWVKIPPYKIEDELREDFIFLSRNIGEEGVYFLDDQKNEIDLKAYTERENKVLITLYKEGKRIKSGDYESKNELWYPAGKRSKKIGNKRFRFTLGNLAVISFSDQRKEITKFEYTGLDDKEEKEPESLLEVVKKNKIEALVKMYNEEKIKTPAEFIALVDTLENMKTTDFLLNPIRTVAQKNGTPTKKAAQIIMGDRTQ